MSRLTRLTAVRIGLWYWKAMFWATFALFWVAVVVYALGNPIDIGIFRTTIFWMIINWLFIRTADPKRIRRSKV